LISLNPVSLPLWQYQNAKVPRRTNIIYLGREHKTNHNIRAINIHTEFNHSVFNQSKISNQTKTIQNHKYTKSEVLNIAKMHGVKIITKKIKLRVCRRIKTTANEVHVISKLVDVEVHRVKACVDTIQAVINMCSESS